MSHRRLLPDFSEDSDQSINALLKDHLLGNSGNVGEQIAFALVWVLRSFTHQFEDLVTFLETVLYREPPSLYVSDRFSDQYLRINGSPHEIVKVEFKASELRQDNDNDWVMVEHPKEELHSQNHSQRLCSDRILPALKTEYAAAVLKLPACLY